MTPKRPGTFVFDEIDSRVGGPSGVGPVPVVTDGGPGGTSTMADGTRRRRGKRIREREAEHGPGNGADRRPPSARGSEC